MKKLILIASMMILFVASTISPAAADQKPITLVFENVFPSTHSRMGERVVGLWLDAVEKNSNGRIKFERHWAGALVPPKETLDALSVGTLDLIMAFPPYFSGKVGIADVCAMPKNFKTYADIYDLWWNSPMGSIIDKVYQKKANAKFLYPSIFAAENFQISKKTKKISELSDFSGLKVRAGGGALNATVRAIGATPVQLMGGEYYTAMQRGTVDAGLMATYSLETYKMWEVCDQVVNPPIFNHCFVGVWMNLDKWKSLPPELQKIFIQSARDLETHWIAHCEMDDARITKIAQSKGVQFYTFPPAEQAKMWKAVAPVWDTYIANCKKQGLEKEAQQIREIIEKRFDSYND